MTRSTVPSGLSRILRSGRSRSSGSRSSRARLTGARRRHRAARGSASSSGAGRLVGAAVDRGLRLRVVQLRGRAHQDAMEGVAALAAVGADHHAHRERGAVLVRPQRAEIVGDALGQHRHDAVGEIDRVAAHQRLAVERGAGRHVMRDVGDRDVDDEAAGIVRVGVGLGVHRVVVVLGVDRIDGDQRHVAPVLAALRARPAARPRPRPAPRGGTRAGCRARGSRSG